MFATTDRKNKAGAPAPYPLFYGGTHARAYARLFGAIARGGVLDNVRVLNETTIKVMRQRQWESESIASPLFQWLAAARLHGLVYGSRRIRYGS